MKDEQIKKFIRETMELQKQAEYMEVKISEIHPFKGNPSIPGPMSVEMLKTSITGQGFVEDVILYRYKGKLMMIAGHKRVDASKSLGLKTVPAKIYPFKSYKHAVLYCVASNRIGQLAETDYTKLKECIEYCDDGAMDLELSGFSQGEQGDIIDYSAYDPGDIEFIESSDRRVVTIVCKSDDEINRVKRALGIEDRKQNTMRASELFEILEKK